jgi:hypothetical protein
MWEGCEAFNSVSEWKRRGDRVRSSLQQPNGPPRIEDLSVNSNHRGRGLTPSKRRPQAALCVGG